MHATLALLLTLVLALSACAGTAPGANRLAAPLPRPSSSEVVGGPSAGTTSVPTSPSTPAEPTNPATPAEPTSVPPSPDRSAAPTTVPPSPDTYEAPTLAEIALELGVDGMVEVVGSDPQAAGRRGPDLLRELERVQDRPEDDRRLRRALERTTRWLEDGELNPEVGQAALIVLLAAADQNQADQDQADQNHADQNHADQNQPGRTSSDDGDDDD